MKMIHPSLEDVGCVLALLFVIGVFGGAGYFFYQNVTPSDKVTTITVNHDGVPVYNILVSFETQGRPPITFEGTTDHTGSVISHETLFSCSHPYDGLALFTWDGTTYAFAAKQCETTVIEV